MFTDLDNTIQTYNCGGCQNETICKFADDFKELQEKAKLVKVKSDSPFNINASCKKYKSCLVGNIREPVGWRT